MAEIIELPVEEYKLLVENADHRVWIGFEDLMELTNIRRAKLDTFLKRHRDELDVENNGPVKYPDGGKWSFEKEGILLWLKENHARLWREDK